LLSDIQQNRAGLFTFGGIRTMFSHQAIKKMLPGCLLLIVALFAHSGRAQQEAAKPERQEESLYSLRALLNGSGFVRIPAGEFMMGSKEGNDDEKPAHRVRIRQGFEMGKFEVTQAQWQAVMSRPPEAHARPENTPAAANPSHFKGSNLPVENVSWDEVQQFLLALNARDHQHEYRLPTEAEWEYACRAGQSDTMDKLEARAWYRDNSEGRTQSVGQKQPNAWGLYDMHGNVWEWVQDWYDPHYYRNSPATDPHGPKDASYRVYRGGSWYSSASDCRAAMRGFDLPANHYYSLGFRLVRTPKK
jgi:formylglycine-generating enzyme required for sulfatase activity